jgi:HAD superfamily hydrolase (TIGR01509 family)
MARLALFDLDDTLIDLFGAFERFAAEFADARGLGAAEAAWLVAAWDPHQKRDEFFAVVREWYGLPDPVADLWAHYRSRMPHHVVCRPEVADALAALRGEGWRLGIVTNGEADNQLGKIERTGLGRLVDAVAVSGALGVRKPDPAIFAAAAAQAGCDLADGGWMVGDNPHADCEGALAAGLRTIWVDGGRDRFPGVEVRADHVVRDVLDAFPLLV